MSNLTAIRTDILYHECSFFKGDDLLPSILDWGWNLVYGLQLIILEQGVSLRHIQKLLGHNSSKTTEIYTQVSKQEISKIKNPLDGFYKQNSSVIQPNTGGIVPLQTKYKRNKHN